MSLSQKYLRGENVVLRYDLRAIVFSVTVAFRTVSQTIVDGLIIHMSNARKVRHWSKHLIVSNIFYRLGLTSFKREFNIGAVLSTVLKMEFVDHSLTNSTIPLVYCSSRIKEELWIKKHPQIMSNCEIIGFSKSLTLQWVECEECSLKCHLVSWWTK